MRRLCVTVFLAAVSMILLAFPGPGSPGPRAVFPIQAHDFGAVRQGEKLLHVFLVRNVGSAPLTIGRADIDVPGMTARLTRVVPVGGEGRITLEWDTSRAQGPTEAKIVVSLDDPAESRVTLTLKADVKAPIDILPYAATFFSVYRGETAQRTVRVVNNEERPLRVTKLEPDGRHFAATLTTIQPGKVYEVLVKVPPDTPPGRYHEAVYLHTDHPTQSRLKVAVNVLVKTDPFVDPDVVDFGMVRRDELATSPRLVDLLTQKFTIKKRHGEFRITSVASDLPFVKVTRSPATASGLFEIDVALVKDRLQPGKIAGSIQVRTSDRKFPRLVVPVRGEVK